MWSPWGRSSPRFSTGAGASPRHAFPCSSFKDVHRLYSDDDPTSPRNNTSSSSSLQLTRPEPENENPNPHRPHPLPTRKTKPLFHRVRVASSLIRNWPTPTRHAPRIADADTRIVVYFTSLRAVRPTFEACRAVRSILGGYRVAIDERDVAMDASFLEEVNRVLRTTMTKKVTLPAVFIGGWYVGGAEEVRQMNEVGELKRLLEVLPKVESRACGACGGYRFVVCGECNGSRKVYGGGDEKVGFRACTKCNENGLIKCRDCYPTALVPR